MNGFPASLRVGGAFIFSTLGVPGDRFSKLSMENGMDRAQKPVVVSDLNAVFGEVGVVVVTRNLGLTVAQSTDLRTKMREAGATYKVTKNSLAKIASKGTAYEQIGDMLTGPVALATSSSLASSTRTRTSLAPSASTV